MTASVIWFLGRPYEAEEVELHAVYVADQPPNRPAAQGQHLGLGYTRRYLRHPLTGQRSYAQVLLAGGGLQTVRADACVPLEGDVLAARRILPTTPDRSRRHSA